MRTLATHRRVLVRVRVRCARSHSRTLNFSGPSMAHRHATLSDPNLSLSVAGSTLNFVRQKSSCERTNDCALLAAANDEIATLKSMVVGDPDDEAFVTTLVVQRVRSWELKTARRERSTAKRMSAYSPRVTRCLVPSPESAHSRLYVL